MLCFCSISTTNSAGSLELSGNVGDPEVEIGSIGSWPGGQRQRQRIVVQPDPQIGAARVGRGAEVGPWVFHTLSEMDHNRLKVLNSNERVRTEMEFPSGRGGGGCS